MTRPGAQRKQFILDRVQPRQISRKKRQKPPARSAASVPAAGWPVWIRAGTFCNCPACWQGSAARIRRRLLCSRQGARKNSLRNLHVVEIICPIAGQVLGLGVAPEIMMLDLHAVPADIPCLVTGRRRGPH